MSTRAEPPLRVAALGFGPAGAALGGTVDFTLREGRILAVLGANGAGKTTLFRTLFGAIAPVCGTVQWAGVAVGSLAPAELARCAAWVPQSPGAGFDFSVFDYVLLGRLGRAGVLSAPGQADRDIAREAIADLGIEALATRRLSRLSGGERQLAAIARALAQQARVLVLDEPTASLDLSNQARVLDRLALLAASGPAILFSTHEPNHALQVAHDALLLRRGDEARFGSVDELIRPEALEWAYSVAVEAAYTADGSMVVARRSQRGLAR
ncbi:MAG: ABC transporter ATP-binding protein [Burkholderiaceae bacterium]|nr:ABC transporter ATP-binding protein [Burkholderiaceae bacterium]